MSAVADTIEGMSPPRLSAVRADITALDVDAVVNAANRRMRGGGGVDGAIHRAGGPAVLQDCIARFPRGLATGDAGWTTGGDLPARWVIHTVGPNYRAGETDRRLLESCYSRSLEVADELGARSIAFPLISAGIYGWPRRDAIAAAVDTIASATTTVDSALLVAFDQAALEEIDTELARDTPLRILQGVRELHRRGHGVRVLPGMSPTGLAWRVSLTTGDDLLGGGADESQRVLRYTTGSRTRFAGGEVTVTTTPEEVADLVESALALDAQSADPAYARWFDELLATVERQGRLPYAYDEDLDDAAGWEIGRGSGVRHPPPPPPPG